MAKFWPALLVDVSAGVCQGTLVDESGMIRTQMRTHNRSECCRSALDALYGTTPSVANTSNGKQAERKNKDLTAYK
jgi:hypothetical protein